MKEERKKKRSEEKRSELLCRVLNNVCRYSKLKEEETNSSFLKCGPHIVTSFQRIKDKMV